MKTIKEFVTAYAMIPVWQVLAVFMATDAFFALAWAWSGQFPVDNFYLGTVTVHIVRFFF